MGRGTNKIRVMCCVSVESFFGARSKIGYPPEPDDNEGAMGEHRFSENVQFVGGTHDRDLDSNHPTA